MQIRLVNFLEQSEVIYSLQFGFRSNHSTTTALINCSEQIRQALDSGNFACSIFIDLQKAFDTVDLDILFTKLSHYGIRGIALTWFKSFLSNRSQFVSVSGAKSTSKPILYGVPQGSVLGPLLFLVYINDLQNAIPYSVTNLFADDTMLFLKNKSVKFLSKKMNIDLKCLLSWLNSNKIALNSKKTELLIFHTRRKHNESELKIKLNGHRLYPSDSVKYLGVFIDSKLSWNPHRTHVCKKLATANGALSKLRHFVDRDILTSLYYASFHSRQGMREVADLFL